MKAVMYHYVRMPSEDLPFFRYLHFESFKKQLDYFEKNYNFISREDFINTIKGDRKLDQKDIVLTFDDGFTDHYDFVYKEFKKRGLWGIFFVPTGVYKKKYILDVHKIHILIGKVPGERLMASLQNFLDDSMIEQEKISEFKSETYKVQQGEEDHIKNFKRYLNYYVSYENRAEIIRKIWDEYIQGEYTYQNFYLSYEQMKEMKDGGMILGSHTDDHLLLSRLNYDEQYEQIVSSMDFLDEKSGVNEFRTFCYPYGGFLSFNEESVKILNEANFDLSFNVESRNIEEDDIKNKPQMLPRFDCNEFKYGSITIGQ